MLAQQCHNFSETILDYLDEMFLRDEDGNIVCAPGTWSKDKTIFYPSKPPGTANYYSAPLARSEKNRDSKQWFYNWTENKGWFDAEPGEAEFYYAINYYGEDILWG